MLCFSFIPNRVIPLLSMLCFSFIPNRVIALLFMLCFSFILNRVIPLLFMLCLVLYRTELLLFSLCCVLVLYQSYSSSIYILSLSHRLRSFGLGVCSLKLSFCFNYIIGRWLSFEFLVKIIHNFVWLGIKPKCL